MSQCTRDVILQKQTYANVAQHYVRLNQPASTILDVSRHPRRRMRIVTPPRLPTTDQPIDSTHTGFIRPRNLPHFHPSHAQSRTYLFHRGTRIALNPESHDLHHPLTTKRPTRERGCDAASLGSTLPIGSPEETLQSKREWWSRQAF